MTTIAIVGAGADLGAAVARKFGTEGFDVALVSRTQSNADDLASQLSQKGITARGYAADVRDAVSLTGALNQAAAELGPIDVLEYSPVPQREFLKPLADTTRDDLRRAIEFSVLGPLAAVQAVLPGIREGGTGTLLFVNGSSAAQPNPNVAGTSIAFAAEGADAQMLHTSLDDSGIHVAQLINPGAIRPGHLSHDPDALAERLWDMHTNRDSFRDFAEPLPV